jgi:hypothetical protein
MSSLKPESAIVKDPKEGARQYIWTLQVRQLFLRVQLHNFYLTYQVVYGDLPSQAPTNRVREFYGQNDDINYQFGGK